MDTALVTAALDGGAKKRKKKTYTTPREIEHKRKRAKLAVPKLYKVDSNDEITKLEMLGERVLEAHVLGALHTRLALVNAASRAETSFDAWGAYKHHLAWPWVKQSYPNCGSHSV